MRRIVRYLLLLFGDTRDGTGAEAAGGAAEWSAYGSWLRSQGWMVAAGALHGTAQATTVSVRPGDQGVTDGSRGRGDDAGPMAFCVIDGDNLDDAIEAAGRFPGAGSVEIHPVREITGDTGRRAAGHGPDGDGLHEAD
jgi:hypothetical protein